MNDITSKILQIGQQAKEAAKLLAKTSTDTKNKALLSMADHIKNNKQNILDANNTDIENGSKKGLSDSFLSLIHIYEPTRLGMIA